MNADLAAEILEAAEEARALYESLVLVVGPAGAGKSRALQEAARLRGVPVVNLNLELSRRLLDVPVRRRPFRAAELARDVVAGGARDPAILDNLEILFHPQLRLDPLRLLRSLARDRTVVASWGGRLVEGDRLLYAEPGHPEYRRLEARDVVIVDAGSEDP